MKRSITLAILFALFYAVSFGQITITFTTGFQIINSGSGDQSAALTLSDGESYTFSVVGTGGFSYTGINTFDDLVFTRSGTISYFSIARTDGTEFELDNIDLLFNIGDVTDATLTGYRDGSMVSGASQAITFVQNVDQTIDVSSNTAFDLVDEFRISYPGTPNNNGTIQMNSIQYQAVTLPVELNTFEATVNKNEVNLTWETLTEIDHKGFWLERSTDARSFEVIAEFPATENQFEPKTYHFTDQNPQAGINYYRLRQMDHDGSESFSEILSVKIEANIGAVQVFPNPSGSGQFNLRYDSGKHEVISVSIVDVQGKVVYQNITSQNPGLVDIPINLSDQSNGTYILMLITESKVIHKRIVIQQ